MIESSNQDTPSGVIQKVLSNGLKNRKKYDTFSELAINAEISVSYISHIKDGSKIPSLDIVDALTNALGLNSFDFFLICCLQTYGGSLNVDVFLEEIKARMDELTSESNNEG